MSTFVDQRLETVHSWDDLKTALGLRAPTIAKLKASDPHQRDADGTPLHIVWNEHEITSSDARQLWQALNEATDEPADPDPADSADVDTQPADSTPDADGADRRR